MKVIFFDVDGTLLSHNTNQIPESTIQALDLLKEKGILRVLCTGRHMKELEEMNFSYMDFDAWILLNGQLILNKEKQVIWSNPVINHTLIDLFVQNKYPIQLLEEKDFYINYVNDYVRFAQKSIHTAVPEIKKYNGNVIYQGIGFVNEEQEKELKKLLKDCLITRWNPYAVDIVSKDGGKGQAIKQFLHLYNLSKDESMAFGDGFNDQDMLKEVNIGVAMGNSVDELKEMASYVTSDIDYDGIYNALIHFNIL